MPKLLRLVALALWLFGSTALAQNPVVIELFTSEGCSSCPPADALAAQLSRMQTPSGGQIILLGEHVDYWNHDGWKDRFSSPQFTARQQDYAYRFKLASPYTPQVVVNGAVQLLGNDKAQLTRAVTDEANKNGTAALHVSVKNGNTVHISGQVPEGRKYKLFLALTEDGLTSEVAAGENGGRTLTHAGVVRELYDLGNVKPGQFERDRTVDFDRRWNAANVKVVAWLQESSSGPIAGAASVPYSEAPSGQTTASAK